MDMFMIDESKKTDQQKNGEQVLRDMQAANSGTLEVGPDSRLRLVHPPDAPLPPTSPLTVP